MSDTDESEVSSGLLIRPLLILGMLLLVLLASGMYAFGNLRAEVRHVVNDNLESIAKLKEGEISAWLDDRMSDAQSLSSDAYFSGAIHDWVAAGRQAGPQRDALSTRLNDFLNTHNFRSIGLYDKRGQLLLDAGLRSKEAEHLIRDIPLAIQSGRPVFVDLHRHGDDSFPVGLGFVSPMKYEGEVVGAVYFSEDPQRYLFPVLRGWPVSSDTGEILLVRKEQNSVLFLNESRFSGKAAMELSLPLNSQTTASWGGGDRWQDGLA